LFFVPHAAIFVFDNSQRLLNQLMLLVIWPPAAALSGEREEVWLLGGNFQDKEGTMNKAELIDKIAEATGITRVMAGKALDSVLNNMGKAMEGGERVIFSGFGSFHVAERAERKGRNPQTGETISIPAHNVVKFKPGKNLRSRVMED
jgi:DNA-binding protein HU-beta